MVDYLYDGTFEGVLTCIYHHYYSEKASGIFLREEYQSTMLGGYQEVETDADKAITVYEAIEKKISSGDLKRVYKVFASDVKEKECKILNYVRLGFVRGSCISLLHGEPIVFAAQEAEKRVNNEVHKLKGLVRFSELENGVLYSPIEPQCDVVEFLAPHFCDRFKNEAFLIHDVRRGKPLRLTRGSGMSGDLRGVNLPPFPRRKRTIRICGKLILRIWRFGKGLTHAVRKTGCRCGIGSILQSFICKGLIGLFRFRTFKCPFITFCALFITIRAQLPERW